jgi:hypothetical protein
VAWSGAWPNLKLQNYRKTFELHVQLVSKPADHEPDEVSQALARFLVVRTCGYIEAVSEECVGCYAESKSSPQIARYSRSWLGRGRNPSPGNLIDLASKFDQQWASEMQALLKADDDRLKRDLDLMIDRRNKIAHGLGENVTARKALDFAETGRTLSDWIIQRFDPR